MATPKTAKTSTAKTPTAPKPIESLTTPKPAESSNINNDSTPKAPESAPKKGFLDGPLKRTKNCVLLGSTQAGIPSSETDRRHRRCKAQKCL
ncbi:hypothetical protein PGTUg99_007321 [Puccinia graminis f. sp. tritici]|uniref:Uncharacterized protein n=1 Tax=Puccinia graminis f. sp. tritici TaxID=56615 RepID=A0A5B0NXA8_PUCGR|nr:hypothetical protein PGTUg99_007321 [Puccinia graminis f. sp. tritici]